jgi:hypothetical protein
LPPLAAKGGCRSLWLRRRTLMYLVPGGKMADAEASALAGGRGQGFGAVPQCMFAASASRIPVRRTDTKCFLRRYSITNER